MFTEGNRKFLYIGIGIFLVFVLIIVFVLVKSGGKKSSSSATTTLTIWGSDDDASAFTDIINNFQNSNDVKVTFVKKDATTYLTDSLAEIAAGRGPDIWIVPNTWLPKYHDQMTAMPANSIADKKAKKSDVEVYQSTFPKVVATDNIINNQIFGMPIAGDTLELYYNNNLFSAALSTLARSGSVTDSDRQILTSGPKNWDEFARAAQLVTQKNGSSITLSGAAMGTSTIANANDILTVLMLQNGVKMTSDDLSTALFAVLGAKSLDYYNSFANPASANYAWSDSLGDSLHAFAQGKSAMMIGYKSQESDIKRINASLSYQTINLPQVKETKTPVNFASYDTFTVTRAAKDSALAWKFITSTAIANNNNGIASYLTATKQQAITLAKLDPAAPIITAQNWYVPDPVKTPQIFVQMIASVNAGGSSQTAMENAASQVTTLLKALK